jgi:hypothetical protein
MDRLLHGLNKIVNPIRILMLQITQYLVNYCITILIFG